MATGELRLAQMKRMLSLELDLLKAILEGNADATIPDRHYQHIQDYHLGIYGMPVKKILPANIAGEFGFNGEVVRSGSLVEMMSTDFALTIASQPLAVLRPNSVRDIAAAVKMANTLDIPLAARGSQVSHSAGGQAQADNGLLLDMSTLSSVEFVRDGQAVKVEAGAFWDKVIRHTLYRGLMPPVVNDYQYLSVGGTLSMGGVGFMSSKYGVQAGYVEEMEVVTGLGDTVKCSPEDDLFDVVRGGLGQVSVIGSVTIPLIKAPQKIATFRLFYNSIHAFIEDVEFYVSRHIDMIHAFLKPCTMQSLSKIIGEEALLSSSVEFQSAIKSGEIDGSLVFFLELGCYMPEGSPNESRQLEANTRCIGGEIFAETQDFQDYITKDPPVVETNKAHGKVPHPSFATTIAKKHTVQLLEYHVNSPSRGNDNVNEILIMPVKSNETLNKGSPVPMFPLPEGSTLSFFLLFVGSVVPHPGSEDVSEAVIMESIRAHHRSLYKLSAKLGGKRYSYDTITSEVTGEEAWRDHYGETVWERLRAAKRKYDPYHILCPGIKMWD